MYIEYYDANGLVKTLGDIEHYNHNHDALGRFARSAGNFMTGGSSYDLKKMDLAEGVYIDSRQMRKAVRKMQKDSRKWADNKQRTTQQRDAVRKEAQNELKKNKTYQKLDKELNTLADKITKNEEKQDKIMFSKEWKTAAEYDKLFYNTSDGKKLDKLVKEANSLEKQYNKKFTEYNKERYRTTDKYLGKYADATMSDLKLNDDSWGQVRKFIVRTTPDRWDTNNRNNETVGALSNTVVSYTDLTKRQKERKSRVNKYETQK